MRPIATAITLLFLVGACESAQKTPVGKSADPVAAKTEAKQAPAEAGDAIELLEKATERRLYPERVESSSFLWNDWNRFQENYHPTYLSDDDPKTAWVEGAKGNGEGESVTLHLTSVGEVSEVRLRLLNGYHKSASLHKKNGRAKVITVTARPSGKSAVVELADNMDWQEVKLVQPAGKLDAVEIKIESTYPGSKYADLCISDAELFVTSRTPENPAFEKKKLASVNAWKSERIAAAKLFKSKSSKSMPIEAGYRVVGKSTLPESEQHGSSHEEMLIKFAIRSSYGNANHLTAAMKGFANEFADWTPLNVSVKEGRRIPAVDGLYVPEGYEFAYEYIARDDAYAIPIIGKLESLVSSRLAIFESSEKTTVTSALAGKVEGCKREGRGHHTFFVPPRTQEQAVTAATLGVMLIVECGRYEEREGYDDYAGLQLVVYNDKGLLTTVIQRNAVTAFEWSGDKITSGKRVRVVGKKVLADRLVIARTR